MTKPGATDLHRRDLIRLASVASLAAAIPASAFAQAAKLKIATIGSGREGGALGTQFAKAGHPVMFSSRHPEELKDLVEKAGPNSKAVTISEASTQNNAGFSTTISRRPRRRFCWYTGSSTTTPSSP